MEAHWLNSVVNAVQAPHLLPVDHTYALSPLYMSVIVRKNLIPTNYSQQYVATCNSSMSISDQLNIDLRIS